MGTMGSNSVKAFRTVLGYLAQNILIRPPKFKERCVVLTVAAYHAPHWHDELQAYHPTKLTQASIGPSEHWTGESIRHTETSHSHCYCCGGKR